MAAQTDFLSGQYQTVNYWQEKLAPLATTTTDKLRVANAKISALFVQAKHQEIIDWAVPFLKKYGINLNPNPGKAALLPALINASNTV